MGTLTFRVTMKDDTGEKAHYHSGVQKREIIVLSDVANHLDAHE